MTTLIPFAPVNTAVPPFSTPLTLDGTSYQGSVTWNVYGQRWYLSIIDQNGNTIWNGAMVGSALNYDVPLAPGIFSTSKILYRENTGNIEVTP